MTREYRYVELVNERGAKRVLTLEPGRDTGVWCLAGDGTLRPAGPEVHGATVFLRYDGARLFVGTQWEELEAPASTTTGGLRIAYRVGAAPSEGFEFDDQTEVRAPMVSHLTHGADFDEEATRVRPPIRPLSTTAPLPAPHFPRRTDAPASAPITVTARIPTPVAAPVPAAAPVAAHIPGAAPAPVPALTSISGAVTAVGPGPILHAVSASPARAKGHFGDDETRVGPPPDVRHLKVPSDPPSAPFAFLAQETTKRNRRGPVVSPVRVAILAMMVATVALISVGSSRKKIAAAPPADKAPKTVLAAAGAHAAPPTASAAHPVAVPPAAVAAAATVAVPAAAPAAPAPPAAVAPAGPLDERAAVLAVESGATDRAAHLYDALAIAHPDKPAYREAARILRAKGGAQ